MGVVVSSSHIVSVTPFTSAEGLLIMFPCSSVGSFPQETLHELLHCESILRVTVTHELFQCGSIPIHAVPQEQAAVWFSHRVTSPASKPAPI